MRLTCGNCGNSLEAMATEQSTLIVCPKCSQVVQVPHDGGVHSLGLAETLPVTPPVQGASAAGTGATPPASPLDTPADSASPENRGPGRTAGGPPLQLFGNYELLAEIARGGMGVVFKARQVRLDRVVALKMILGGRFASPQDVERFYTEATAAAQLQHPGIVPVFEFGEHDGCHYYSMGFVEGYSLAERLEAGPLPPQQAAGLGVDIALAVEYAHVHGVIHRDLKPGNILMDGDGSPRITDFGLAKRVETEGSHTLTGQVLGTPSFMAPEQAAGDLERVGPASDVYALGAMLYAMLTGHPPFRAASLAETLRQVQESEPVSPRQLNPAVDRDLETICLKCLQKEPARRYTSAQALADDLERFRKGEPIHARPVGLIERAVRWCRREPALAGLIGVIGGLLMTLAVGGYIFALRESGLRANEKLQRIAAQQATARAREETERAEKEAREKAKALEQVAAEKAKAEQLAKEKAEEAEQKELARKAAVAAQERSEALAARAVYDQALAYLTSGEHRRGLLWLVRALEQTPPREAELQRSIRLALSAWRDGYRRPRLVFDGRRYGQYAALSPDGRRVVIDSPRSGWRIWDTVTGEPLSELLDLGAAPLEGARTAIYSRDGQRLATIGPGREVRLFDGPTGKLLHVLEHPKSPATGQFAPGGKRFAARVDGQVVLWDVETGRQIGPPLSHELRHIYTFDFSSNGQRLATGGDRGVVKLWNASTGEAITTLPAQATPVTRLAFTDQGRALLTLTAAGALQAWNVETVQPIGKPLEVQSMAVAPAGKVVTLDRRWGLQFWTLTGDAMAPLGSLKALHAPATVALAAEADVLVTIATDQVRAWIPHAESAVGQPLQHTGVVFRAELSQDGKTLLTLADDGSARIWDVAPPARGKSLAEEPGTQNDYAPQAVFSPDGRYVLTAHDPGEGVGRCQLWDVASGQPHGGPLEQGATIRAMAFSGDGQSVLVAGDKGIRRFDVRDGKRLAETPLDAAGCSAMIFTPDLRTLLTVGRDGLQAWDAQTGTRRWQVTAPEGGLGFPAAVSRDGRWLAISRYREFQGVSLYDLQTGTERGAPIRNLAPSSALEFSPNGQLLAVAAHDRVQLWNVLAGRPWGATLRHVDGINCLAWSPEGARLLTGSLDHTARLWDVKSGDLQAEFRQGERMTSVAFNPDGLIVATAGRKTARLWDTSAGQPLGEPLSRAGERLRGLTFSPTGALLWVGGRTEQLASVRRIVDLDLKRLRDWVEVLTGMRLEANNSIRVLEADEWRLRRARLQRSGVALDD